MLSVPQETMMNYSGIKAQVIKITGRKDFIGTGGADNGLLVFVNAAQRELDHMSRYAFCKRRRFWTLSRGDYYVRTRDIISIDSVHAIDSSSNDSIRLNFAEYDTAIAIHGIPEQQTHGSPVLFAITPIGLAPDQQLLTQQTVDGFKGSTDTLIGTFYLYDGITLFPKVDKEYTLQVTGEFFNEPFSADTDTSVWSVREPMTLVYNTVKHIEMSYGNKESYAFYDEIVRRSLSEINMSTDRVTFMANDLVMGG